MVKYVLIGFTVFALSALGYSYFNDDIDFASEGDKFDYCVSNPDHSVCDFYRPFIVFASYYFELRGYSFANVDTETMKSYRYSKSYKSDLVQNSLYCKSHSSDIRCRVVSDNLEVIKMLRGSL